MRPSIGDRIGMRIMDGDAEIQVGDIPDGQPLEASGILIVTDRDGGKHLIGEDAGMWVAMALGRLSDRQFEAYEAYEDGASVGLSR
jgi:hypothetical protein